MNVHGWRADLLVIYELFYCRVVSLCISFSFCLLIEGGMEGLYIGIVFVLVRGGRLPRQGQAGEPTQMQGVPP